MEKYPFCLRCLPSQNRQLSIQAQLLTVFIKRICLYFFFLQCLSLSYFSSAYFVTRIDPIIMMLKNFCTPYYTALFREEMGAHLSHAPHRCLVRAYIGGGEYLIHALLRCLVRAYIRGNTSSTPHTRVMSGRT